MDVFGRGVGARVREVGRGFGFGAGCFVDFFGGLGRENAFGDERGLEDLDRVFGATVVFDLGLSAVSIIRIGDGVAAVTVGADLDNGGFAFLAGDLEEFIHRRADFVNVVAFADAPRHAVAFSAFGEFAGGGTGLAGAHGITVVLDDENAGKVPERGEIVGLVHGALVDGAIAHERHGRAFVALIFYAVSEAHSEGDLAADDAVAAPVIALGRKEMHRAAFAFGATGDFAVELGHEGLGVHADGDGVTVVAVGGDDVVMFAHERTATDGDGLLAVIKMEEAADVGPAGGVLAGVGAVAALFEAADAHHLAEEFDLLGRGQRGINGGLAVAGVAGGGFLLDGGARFLAHG